MRVPLAATAALLVAIDCIGLGMHLADATNNAAVNAPRAQARTTVTAPNAVVGSDVVEAAANARRNGKTTPSGVLIGPVAPPVVTSPQNPPTNATPPPPAPAVPLAQVDAAVPALGARVALGLGDNSCTTVDLTLIALGDCPAPQGDGAVILNLGGTLLGQ